MTFREYMFNLSGYVVKTTFWEDFSIADPYGVNAIKDTYNRAFNEWKDNIEYITELSLVLNHKIWVHHGRGNDQKTRFPEYHKVRAEVYDELWRNHHDWCIDNLKGDNLDYYLSITD